MSDREPWSPEQLSTIDHQRAYTGRGSNVTARGSRGGSVIEVQPGTLNSNIAVPRRRSFDRLSTTKFLAHRRALVELERFRIRERLRVFHSAAVDYSTHRELADLSADRSRNVVY